MEISSTCSPQNPGKTRYQLLLIEGIKKEIEAARKLDLEKLAAEIRKKGFSCQHCGRCCMRAFGDNRVLLIPCEIEKIQKYTGLPKLEVVEPFLPEVSIGHLCEDIDCEGNIHSFAWALRRKTNGDCIFFEKSTCKCRIYPVRPCLCKTYPFYLENLRLQTCECEGLGYFISPEESRKIAKNLLLRYISELEDTLAMYEKFIDFERGEKGIDLAKQKFESGSCTFIVHDSTGSIKFIDKQNQ